MPRAGRRAESRCRHHIRVQAGRRGWSLAHPSRGGDVLERQELAAHFPGIGSGPDGPDFLFCLSGAPCVVARVRDEAGRVADAVAEATRCAEAIHRGGAYDPRIAVGAAGGPGGGFEVSVRYRCGDRWVPLTSSGFELTSFPSRTEVELALRNDSGTTRVSVPSPAEFVDAAVEVSRLLRLARIEAPLRPKVIGALVLALSRGDEEVGAARGLAAVDGLVSAAIDDATTLDGESRSRLKDALALSGADFHRLEPHLARVSGVLRRLNVRSVVHTDADFLGMFYEAFLRYGYDNNALGIVFTPRHVAAACVALAGISPSDQVIDIACGTGGFLVSAADAMASLAGRAGGGQGIGGRVAGFDTNPTVWALAMVNMLLRGGVTRDIHHEDCFSDRGFEPFRGRFTRAFLNPPYSQAGEPEHRFIDRAMEALQPGGVLAAVVKAGVFADDDHRPWRRRFLGSHRLLGVVSLPEDLFYPAAAPTSIVLAEAHVPTRGGDAVFLARVWNDGFTKLKGKRVEVTGNQIPEVERAFADVKAGRAPSSPLATTILAREILEGEEWSPQQWLPQPAAQGEQVGGEVASAARSVFQAVAAMPELASVVLDGFGEAWAGLPRLPYGSVGPVSRYFDVQNGRSAGESNYSEGEAPYVSSGDGTNSIVRCVAADEEEVFPDGGITVTAFGTAALQPWPLLARGNGGSAVRVLVPRYAMTLREMLWFVAQINLQRWRFFYARMAIKSRLERLVVAAPPGEMRDPEMSLSDRVRAYRQQMDELSAL